jgi:hypothetical protein
MTSKLRVQRFDFRRFFNGELGRWAQVLEWRSSLRMAIQIGVEGSADYRVRDWRPHSA